MSGQEQEYTAKINACFRNVDSWDSVFCGRGALCIGRTRRRLQLSGGDGPLQLCAERHEANRARPEHSGCGCGDLQVLSCGPVLVAPFLAVRGYIGSGRVRGWCDDIAGAVVQDPGWSGAALRSPVDVPFRAEA